jgi:Glycosyltransferase family 87
METLARRSPVSLNLARPTLRAVAGRAALIGLFVAGMAIAIGAAGHSSFLVPSGRRHFPGWMAGPFGALGAGKLTGAMFVLLVLAMSGAYAVALVCAKGLSARWVIGGIVALNLVFLLAPPLLSTDVFSYIDYGRLGAVHGLDPYAHGAAAVRHDPAFPFTGHIWRHTRSVYGPLFTLGTYPLAALGVPAAMWGLKVLMAISSLGICALVWRGARDRGLDPARAAMLFGLNPIVLIYAVGGGHNDLLMLALAMVGVVLIGHRREAWGAGSVVASAAVKVSAIALLPFMVLGSARPRRVLLGAAVGTAAVAAIALIAFGGNAFSFIRDIGKQQSLVSGTSVPSEVTQLFGLQRVGTGVHVIAQALLVVSVAYLLWRTWRGGDWVTAAGWTLLVLSVTTTWLLAWYTLWALPLAAISRSWRLLAATLLLQALFIAHGITPLLA